MGLYRVGASCERTLILFLDQDVAKKVSTSLVPSVPPEKNRPKTDSPSPPERALFLGYALQRIRAVSLKGVCAIVLGRPTSPGAPGGLHTRGSLPLAQPKSRPLGRPFAPRGSPARGLAWRSPPRGGSPPLGADMPPPVPARVPAPQFPQQSPSPSPSPAPLF